ncbi:MAPEG family protein [Hyphomicrobium sp.]|uniref:MAPEG family protein n=1 Tax=Hyphomicrobium sp. TaxID=82 RepID=UPI002C1362DB|nr:MAPEG family protein [Hyphomicrobium sp.]HRN88723.1 MAPEG family protein [Hyphomicrobium sp.]HRQ26690.1 MAPEG family protein [Hyphomicrobium sp.]
MTQISILYPVFVQVLLTFVLMNWMRVERFGAIRRGDVTLDSISLRQPAWPPRATQVANAFHNQLELPILFYALVAFLMITTQVNIWFLILAWVFVIARVVHAVVHTTTNDVRQRFVTHAIGAAALFIMWILFAIRILFFSLGGDRAI